MTGSSCSLLWHWGWWFLLFFAFGYSFHVPQLFFFLEICWWSATKWHKDGDGKSHQNIVATVKAWGKLQGQVNYVALLLSLSTPEPPKPDLLGYSSLNLISLGRDIWLDVPGERRTIKSGFLTFGFLYNQSNPGFDTPLAKKIPEKVRINHSLLSFCCRLNLNFLIKCLWGHGHDEFPNILA